MKMRKSVKYHYVEWGTEKIEQLWEVYETNPIFKEEFLPESFYDGIIREVRNFIPKHGNILDIGFGTSTLIKKLESKGYNCFGADISERNVTNIAQDISKKGLNIKCQKGEISNLPYESNKFDIIFATEVLEHLPDLDLEIGLQEVNRTLKKGGYFVITTPNNEHLTYVVCPDCHAIFSPIQHLQSFDKTRMTKSLERNSFKIIKCEAIPYLIISSNRASMTLLRHFFPIIKRIISLLKYQNPFSEILLTLAQKI